MSIEKQHDTARRNEDITTIKLAKATKARLDHIRVYRRETYDEILQKMLEILSLCRSAPERARIRLIALDKQRKSKKVSISEDAA